MAIGRPGPGLGGGGKSPKRPAKLPKRSGKPKASKSRAARKKRN